MELTGFDRIVFTSIRAEEFLARFIPHVVSIWSHLVMDVECCDLGKNYNGLRGFNDCIDAIKEERHPIVYFFRNNKMRAYLENHGYSLDSRQEGPFAVHLRKRAGILFELAKVSELTSGEGKYGIPDPYPATLCNPTILEITLVLPGSPKKVAFSRKLLNMTFKSCLFGGQKGG